MTSFCGQVREFFNVRVGNSNVIVHPLRDMARFCGRNGTVRRYMCTGECCEHDRYLVVATVIKRGRIRAVRIGLGSFRVMRSETMYGKASRCRSYVVQLIRGGVDLVGGLAT